MGRTGIRYEDVEQAAQSLLRAHINPTHERIRQALGGGSFTTIGRHLQIWRQALDTDGAGGAEAIPPDSLVDAVKGVWQGMRGAAEARVAHAEAQAQQSAESQIAAAKEELRQKIAACEEQANKAVRDAQEGAEVGRQIAARLQEQLRAERQGLEHERTAHRQAVAASAVAQSRAEALLVDLAQARHFQDQLHETLAAQASHWEHAIEEQNRRLAREFAQTLQAQQAAWVRERSMMATVHQNALKTETQAGADQKQRLEAKLAQVMQHSAAQLTQAHTGHERAATAAAAQISACKAELTNMQDALQRARQQLADAKTAQKAAESQHIQATATLQRSCDTARGREEVLSQLRQMVVGLSAAGGGKEPFAPAKAP